MEFIDKEINEQLNREIERPAFEMATTLREATLRIMDRADNFLEHFFKVVFYINDINQNKWRNEMAARITECGKLKNTSTNKKFDIKVYNLLFTTLCSNPEELSEQSEPIYREFLQEGFSEIELNKVDFNDLYTKIRGIADKSLVLMTDKKIYGREDYRKIIDEVL